jgi:pyrrolidone-carboxylate peptidase
MGNNILRKGLVLLVILLFIGSFITQATTSREFNFGNSKNLNLKSSTGLRNIMLTGYWNPTGQMIAPFSNNTYLNPGGWKGANWENRGYNIYSFFPKPGVYNGTFEVDYQDTWEDFWNVTEDIKPIAIISFGAGAGPWEIEYNSRNLDLWIPDNEPPYQPTPCPPDDTKPAGYVRHSTLPVQSIADAVNSQTSITAWIDWSGNPGAYLCEYMAYLGMWYQEMHNATSDPYRCLASGFIHVQNSIPLEDAMEATNITIREVIKCLQINNYPDLYCIGSLSWIDVKAGSTITDSFRVKNIGDPGSMLTWEIESFPDWGTWTFAPESGENLTPEDDYITVGVEVIAPGEENAEYEGDVKVVNLEDPNDYEIIDVLLTTPKNKTFNFNIPIFFWMFERFPNILPILFNLLRL